MVDDPKASLEAGLPLTSLVQPLLPHLPIDSHKKVRGTGSVTKMVVGVVDKNALTRDCIAISLRNVCDDMEVESFRSCEELSRLGKFVNVILYHADRTQEGS